MIELDISQFAADVVNLLMLRGADLPALQWQDKQNQAAKEMLDRIPEDTTLFHRKQLADEGMAAATRGLLYLWNGWPDDCGMYAQAAPDKVRIYLTALCERQAGRAQETKSLLQQLDQHEIYEALMAYSLKAIGLGTDPPLKRLKQMLELGGAWEPYAFVDIFEQARAGKLCHPTEQIVRAIQCREFELLFAHCYAAATGEPLVQRPTVVATRPRRPTPKPQRRHTAPHKPERAVTDQKPPPPPKDPLQRKGPRVGVRCPRCQQMAILPESRRGTKEKCAKCNTVFMVPQKPAAAAESGGKA